MRPRARNLHAISYILSRPKYVNIDFDISKAYQSSQMMIGVLRQRHADIRPRLAPSAASLQMNWAQGLPLRSIPNVVQSLSPCRFQKTLNPPGTGNVFFFPQWSEYLHVYKYNI